MIEINKNKLVPAITATWGEITGKIEDQKDLVSMMSSYATESWVSSQGFLTEHQPLKTINFQSLVGTGNINIEASIPDYYATKSWVQSQGYLTSVPDTYATESWVLSQNYVTSAVVEGYATETFVTTALSSYATESWVESQGYLTSVPSGYATESWVSAQGYLTSETLPSDIATQSWVVSQGYITTSALSGYATESWVESQDYLSGEDPIVAPLVEEKTQYAAKTGVWVDVKGLEAENVTDSNTKNRVFEIGGEIYFWISNINNTIYKFNKQTYVFEPYISTQQLTTLSCMLWEDYDGNVFVLNQDERYYLNMTTGHLDPWYGLDYVPFIYYFASNSINIAKINGSIYLTDYSNGVAYPYVSDGIDSYFDTSSPIAFTAPRSDWYRYSTNYEGHLVCVSGGKMYDLVLTPGVSLEFVELSTPLYPELSGSIPSAQWVKKVGDYYIDMYMPNIYKLENGEWINMNIDLSSATGVKGNACGTIWGAGEMMFGWAYKQSDNYPYLLVVNLSDAAKVANAFILDLNEKLAKIPEGTIATQDWVGNQGFIQNPTIPYEDGTYVLKLTLQDGYITYEWVADEVPQAVQITNEILS